MNNLLKAVAGVALAAAVVAGADVVLDAGSTPATKPVTDAALETAGKQAAVASSEVAADKLRSAVYSKRLADGTVVVMLDRVEPDGGRLLKRLTDSPCRWRPKGSAPGSCVRVLSGGKQVDPGEEMQVLQPGEWVGAGCVQVPCAVMAGESAEAIKP